MLRKASAHWQGSTKEGSGTLSAQSGTLRDTPYSFKARFGDGKGTNPEELLAAAHAGCFTMALSFTLNNAGYTAGDVVRAIPWSGSTLTKPTQGELDVYGAACDAAKLATTTSHHSHNGREWAIGMPAQTLFNTAAPPNFRWPTCQPCVGCGWMDSQGLFPARSRHVGGVHTLLGDGAARFVSENIDLALWQNLGSINGNEPIGEF